MILVVCTTCGVVFDIEIAKRCSGHFSKFSWYPQRPEFCFICPMGHAGHDSQRWRTAVRREPTEVEAGKGIAFMLPEYEVNP